MVPVHTTWDGPLVDSKKIRKIEGKTIDFAYDSHMRNLEKFAEELEAGVSLEGEEQLTETGERPEGEANQSNEEKKTENPYKMTDS